MIYQDKRICAENVMIYPPGIPLVIFGERVTINSIELIKYGEAQGGVVLSDSPDGYIKVIDQEFSFIKIKSSFSITI